ncbi:DUF192 domain-containing protein [Cellulophaga baltica]|uniref:DUF192 domain-containing protein n=1 Tax=Cellulophaga baltica TaxID=76594 RepID=UPI0021492B48|nr:DUF192 domain-containing protein [Cellulophaga baltica]MCR1024567.1 DUF192 domain-containing protein [Cellulophaga baltica]
MKNALVLLSCIILSFLSSCREEPKQAIETAAIAFKKEGELTIYKAKTDSIIASFDIEIAATDYETETGLMYRNTMKPTRGMLFVFPDVAMHSFYMKNTAIPLDIIYIDEHLKIASFQENAIPFNEEGLSSQVPIKYVLEINAGLAEKYLLEVKDSIVYKEL